MKKVILFCIITALILGNFNFINTAADQEESNVLLEEISYLNEEKGFGNERLEQSIVCLLNDYKRENDLKSLQTKDLTFVDNKIRLEIILSEEDKLDALRSFDKNIEVENHYKSLVQVLVPIDIIEQLSEETFVNYIRKPIECQPLVTSEGVGVIGADLVHADGYYGDGVKVAVIDLGFEDYDVNPDIPPERIVEAISYRAGYGIKDGGIHGSACTELVLDIAPHADLYLYSCGTISEFNDAVNRALYNNVDTISFSAGWKNVNGYDGTGYICGIVDNARSQDVLFVVAAGNEAERHYEGTFMDNDGDSYHEFGVIDEGLSLGYLSFLTYIDLSLSWDDWPYSDQDYDLYLYRGDNILVDYSMNIQTGTQPPTEEISGYTIYSDFYYVVIKKYSATRNVYLELYGESETPFLEYNHPESSLTCPADANGAMTAGATHWQTDNLEPFSSRGPTNDGRTKPDVTAPDYVSTWSYGTESFPGTSAATPHTAGAAALLKSVDFSLTADDLQNLLESTALDLGSTGKDNLYGSGRINVWSAYNSINTPPVGYNDYYSVVENGVLLVPEPGVLGNDTDADGDSLTAIKVSDPSNGLLTLNANGSFVYTPNPGYSGSDSFTYNANDSMSDSNIATVYITIAAENNQPIANFSWSADDLEVNFTDESIDTDGYIDSWFWDFEDGNTSTSQNPNHIYSSEGTYSVTLTVTDDDGETDSETKSVTVTSGTASDVYVDDDYNSSTPGWQYDHFDVLQDGIDAVAENGTVHIYNGTYYESVIIEKSINLIGNNKEMTNVVGYSSGYSTINVYVNNVSIEELTITQSYGDIGIRAHNLSIINNLYIGDCIFYENGEAGIELSVCNNSIIRDCIFYNMLTGIQLDRSSHTMITNCTICNNDFGIYFYKSDGTIINNNSIKDNSEDGIRSEDSYNCLIYHNNFINNSPNGIDDGVNFWDNGYPSGGNYWDDYTGVDSDGDGIGDTPYNIPGGSNQDLYPLMHPYGPGIVACWHFDGGSGSTAYDSSGNGNDGTIYGATWTTGISNGALDFDGNDDYVEVPPIPQITDIPMNQITFEGWICLHSDSGVHQFIEGHTSTDEINLETNPDTSEIKFDIVDDTGNLRHISTSALSINNWHHIVGTYDGMVQCIYLDGILEESSSWVNTFTITTGFMLGRDYEGAAQYLDGMLDEVSIYTYALAADEIQALYQQYAPTSPTTVYIDDNYNATTPGWQYDHFDAIQDGIDAVAEGGTGYVYNGTYYEHIILNKKLNLIGEDKNNTIIDGEEEDNDVIVINSNAENTSIQNFTLSGAGTGVQDYAIELWAQYVIVKNCILKDNPHRSVNIGNHYCTIQNCQFEGGALFSWYDIDHISIINCEFINSGTKVIGEYLTFKDCNVDSPSWGLLIENGYYCEVYNNTFMNCIGYGIEMRYSGGNNVFYHNNFINNTNHVINIGINDWYNPILQEGNYWDDYTGTDSDNNGIGDIPYDVPGGSNQDLYPLGYFHPIANYTYAPSNPTTADVIYFTDISIDPDGIIVNWSWDFDDGNISYEQNPTHQYADDETYTVILNVTDDDGATNETTQQIVVANVAPVANDDCYSVAENGTFYISAPGVLENDTDAEGDSLSASLISNALNGVLTLFDNGSFGYTPTVGYNGTDSFTYKAFDGIDYSNEATVTIWVISNHPPYTPSNPSPSDGKTNVDKNKILSWSGGDPDSGDAVTYDVYFGISNPPSKISSNQSGTSYDPGAMSYNTKHYWKIIAWDNYGASAEGSIWSFTTEKQSTQPPYNPPYNPPPTNQNPVADASAGEPYQGFVDEEITFNGSLSYDPDTEGYIVSWYWSYGDGTNGTGETTTHRYYYAGTYTIALTVADNEDAENTCETTVLISQPNRPPSKPSINGPTTGNKNTECIYTAISTDPDNDTIKYSFIWGDQTSSITESEFLPSGSVFTADHTWTVAGKYTITVTTTDNKTISETSKLTVLIDAINVEDIGYFIDINGDGIYDSFHNDTSNQNSDVEYDDGKYLVDDNGDGEWDSTYSMEEGLKSYEKEETLTPGFGLILVVCTLAIVTFWKRKRK